MKRRAAIRKLSFRLIAFVLNCCLLTGCWSSNEINELAIITVLGIDQSESGEFVATALVIRPGSSISQVPGSQTNQTPSLVISTSGKSLFDAMRKMASILSKRMYWAHLQAVIFGKEAADILRIKPQLEGSLGAELHGLIEYSKFSGSAIVNDISHFIAAFASDTKDHMTGLVHSSEGTGVELYEDGHKSYAVSLKGTAVFKEGKLAGWMDRHETRGALWVLGNVKNGVTQLGCLRDQDGSVTLEFTHAASEVKPVFQNNEIAMKVRIIVDAEITEITCEQTDLNSETLQQLNALLKEKVQQDISASFAKAKIEWQSDIFNFGQAIYRKYPKEWKRLAPHWREGGLKDLPVEVQVEANIRRSGLIHDTFQIAYEGVRP